MNTTAILVGLGPLLGWGLYPTIASKIGGKPVNQILGSTLGTLIFALVLAMIKGLAQVVQRSFSQFFLGSVGGRHRSSRFTPLL